MKIHFYTIYDDYRFTIDSPIELENIDKLIDEMTRSYFESRLYRAFPKFKDDPNIEVRFDWLYDGYKLFIIGTKLSDFQITRLCHIMDEAQCVDRETYMDLPIGDYRQYTGITLGYDICNYYRISIDRLIVYIPVSPSESLQNIKSGNVDVEMPKELEDFFMRATLYRDMQEVERQKKKEAMQNGKTEYLYRTHSGNRLSSS